MTTDIYLNTGLLCYTIVGLVMATYITFKHNHLKSKIIHGLYGMYAATIVYLIFIFLDDLGFGEFYHIGSKVIFATFLTIAMPWSLYVAMKLINKAALKKKQPERDLP